MTTLRNETRKKDLSNRLAKVEGQLRGIRKLMEADADCEKIAQQMAAARKALDKTFFSMVGCMVQDKHLPIEKITQMLVKLA